MEVRSLHAVTAADFVELGKLDEDGAQLWAQLATDVGGCVSVRRRQLSDNVNKEGHWVDLRS